MHSVTSSGRAKRTEFLLTRLTSPQGVRLSAQRPVRCRRRRRIEEKAKWVGKEAFSIKVVDVKAEGRDQGATPDGDRGVVVNRGVRETKESHPSPSFRRRKKGKKKKQKKFQSPRSPPDFILLLYAHKVREEGQRSFTGCETREKLYFSLPPPSLSN